MGEINAQTILVAKLEWKIHVQMEDNNKMDLRQRGLEVVDCIYLAQDRYQ
jgi:hypothetical protein